MGSGPNRVGSGSGSSTGSGTVSSTASGSGSDSSTGSGTGSGAGAGLGSGSAVRIIAAVHPAASHAASRNSRSCASIPSLDGNSSSAWTTFSTASGAADTESPSSE